MNRENYHILGVSEEATDEEIRSAYESLKKKYSEDRWLEGEAGTEAARMLEKIDAAYDEITRERREARTNTDGTDAFAEVSRLIKEGNISAAQQKLDSFNERSAEWHYLQSIVFYRKNWLNESKKQLEIAMQMDPSSTKYKESYDRLIEKTNYTQQTGGSTGTNPNPQSGDEQMGGSFCANCASFCYTFLCVNLIFNLCCSCR